MHSESERSVRKARVAAAKDALARSVDLSGPQVPSARSALRDYLRNLDAPRQPNDAAFQELVDAPFRERTPRPIR